MEKTVYSTNGTEKGKIELADSVFNLPVNEDLIYYAINNELANKRLGTACTKDRGEVHGSNAKPYNQKGTGRARRGDKKSPVLVGGGTVFGPKPKDFSYMMPKKAKRLAMKSILSLKASSESFKVLEDFTVDSAKTRDLYGIIKNFGADERTVLIIDDEKGNSEKISKIKRAGRNIPWLSFLTPKRLRAHDLFYSRRVMVLETAAKEIGDFYTKLEASGVAQ
ncbi:MAG: 50S ribosomal protein L4 [Termitinemataceae bacterium]|nr:MAG: 50S ribosomal protein L4 [Termitinemataceae bacterium]